MLDRTLGNDPGGKLEAPANRPKGSVEVLPCVNTQGIGSTSKIPKPPRTAVLPLLKGSHEKPMRGSKLRSVWFDAHRGFTGTSAMLVRVGNTANESCASVGSVTGS